ncbi:MAG: RsmB/NOP family class I SAM-dependent RNA methyltransferase [Alphaproteobacteria bacterium]|nr:RsmB/NOP family class I SAM-dependent RNA methyltransferase [Alphaproteobacteria bacterium]
MTPSARYAAGIHILDQILTGNAAEKVLTNWARRNRFAGSGDRAAIRDLVFDVLRKRRSCGAAGGGETGRGLVLGYLRLSGIDAAAVFTAKGYAAAKLTAAERAHTFNPQDWPQPVRLDYPDWLEPDLQASLGDDLAPVMALMRDRAGVFLRVNPARTDREGAIRALAYDTITAKPHPLAPYALEVLENPRRIAASQAFLKGLVEVQDAASQAIVAEMPVPQTGKILDYCAGGGGKTLAMAATSRAGFFAHDANQARMLDLPKRAARAGVKVTCLESNALRRHAPYDLVFCDVPCSGSGAWRRSPAAKWAFSREKLAQLRALQQEILQQAAGLVATGGVLVYATCSMLKIENGAQVDGFLAENPDFSLELCRQFTPLDGADGLFGAALRRS